MIIEKRQQVERILSGEDEGLVALVGPCANHKSRQIINEGRKLSELNTEGLVTVHRQPHWKPRTPKPNGPKPWEGLEDTNYEAALSRMEWADRRNVSIASELGKPEHIDRYVRLLTFAWIGARSLDNTALMNAITADLDPNLPIGVKNDLSGQIEPALDTIDLINKERHNKGAGALATLVFRGGSDFDTPRLWTDQYLHALDVTEGRLIVDVAHGSEMAFDPSGNYDKTRAGQIACMEAVIELASDGHAPSGIMIEASDYEHPDPYKRTDPNIPFDIALEGILELHKATT